MKKLFLFCTLILGSGLFIAISSAKKKKVIIAKKDNLPTVPETRNEAENKVNVLKPGDSLVSKEYSCPYCARNGFIYFLNDERPSHVDGRPVRSYYLECSNPVCEKAIQVSEDEFFKCFPGNMGIAVVRELSPEIKFKPLLGEEERIKQERRIKFEREHSGLRSNAIQN